MKLETQRLILRDLTMKDARDSLKNLNNLNISQYLLSVSYPYTKKNAEWWVNHCKEQQKIKPRTSYEFGIVIKPIKEVVGGIGLTHIDYEQGTAELGYWIAETHWRNGYVSEGVRKLIDYSFNTLKLRRLTIPAFATNKGSNGLAKSLGFTYEGTLRQAAKCKATGKIHDENVYGLLKEDWKK
ncbi:MAG: GNAT family protein [Nanoarchaeota archaeon]|nr:GNAT family protein [Nanoarchaeota archaeon]